MGICASSETLHDTGAFSADAGGANTVGGDAAAAMLGVTLWRQKMICTSNF